MAQAGGARPELRTPKSSPLPRRGRGEDFGVRNSSLAPPACAIRCLPLHPVIYFCRETEGMSPMAKVTVDVPIERIKELLAQLTPEELRAVLAYLHSRRETFQMMKLAEPAFTEWNAEEDLYGSG